MNEGNILGILIAALIGFLIFVYQNVAKAKLKNRYLSLCVRRQNNLILDSVEDCLEAKDNKRLLTAFFYKINFIDYYVKKIVPITLFIGVFILLYTIFFTANDFMEFKTKPDSSLSNIIYQQGSQQTSLRDGQLIYILDNKIYKTEVNSGSILSFNDKYILTISNTLILLTIIVFLLLLLAVSYFINLTSSDDFTRNLRGDIRYLKEELELVSSYIEDAETKTEAECKSDRLSALKKKKSNLVKLKSSLEKTQSEFE